MLYSTFSNFKLFWGEMFRGVNKQDTHG